MYGGIRVHGPPRIEIAVRLLGGRDAGDEGLKSLVHFVVGLHGEAEGRALDDLVDVGIIKGIVGDGLVLEGALPGGAAAQGLRGEIEVQRTLRGFELIQREPEGHRDVGGLPVMQQPAGEFDLGEGYGRDRIILRSPGGDQRKGGKAGEDEKAWHAHGRSPKG